MPKKDKKRDENFDLERLLDLFKGSEPGIRNKKFKKIERNLWKVCLGKTKVSVEKVAEINEK